MTVYVDDMRAKFRGMLMCHMIADTEEELHAMADKISIKRAWYQGNHYDISLSRRADAVRNGAVEITWCTLAKMKARRRVTGTLGTPGDADKWYSAYNKALVRGMI